jgi:hypothetical protein
VSRQDNPQGVQHICDLEEYLEDQLGVGNVSVGGEVGLNFPRVWPAVTLVF